MQLNLEIITPERVLFSGEIDRVQLPGLNGLFEILKQHAPLISALRKGTVKVTTSGGVQHFAIDDGFVECLHDQVVVLVGGGEEA